MRNRRISEDDICLAARHDRFSWFHHGKCVGISGIRKGIFARMKSIEIVTRWMNRESGLRFLARRKAACAVAVLTMALALGANTLVFSVTKAFLLSSFALPEPNRLFVIAPV